MPRLLIVHHSPSPATSELLDAVVAGASTDELDGIEVIVRPALVCDEVTALEADGYLLGTTANIGYISGALKHFFDRVYYPAQDVTRGRPYAAWIHGNSDTTGAERAIDTIVGGMGWKPVAATLTVIGDVDADAREAAWELGATVAASLVA
ncbi:MAG: hypothetical protein WD377_08420 [Nitriliruptoraceae bacterium]